MVDEAAIFAGLNPEQAHAVQLVEGPVCILAGAGSGKTTTITRRLANQVASGAYSPDSLLAVTFTRKAAGEMRARLARLGIEGIRAMTFHAAALDQLRSFHPEMAGEVLGSKGEILYRIARTLPRPHSFTPLMDLASEIEWAKNQRITPERYRTALGGHEPPIPEEHMERVFSAYERQKSGRGAMDFEDILETTITMFARDDVALGQFRNKIRAVTVDEYQDVNLLQQSLLETWLGARHELCAVGDDYQAIYSFTGASPRHLLDMHERHPGLEVVRLERNYRSTPEVLEVANRLATHLGGAPKKLRSDRPPGPAPVVKAFFDDARENAFVLDTIKRLHTEERVAYDDIAILYRTNARSEVYEELLSGAGIPYQVRDGSFLERPAATRLLPRLRRAHTTQIADEALRLARADGLSETPIERAGQQELTRQKDLAQIVDLAADFEDGMTTAKDFVDDLKERFGAGAKGVNLLTLHSAKGLEFDAVFIPAVEEGELPYKRATDQAIPEERRLLYVGITRAKRFLHVTWTIKRPSRFVAEIKPAGARDDVEGGPRPGRPASEERRVEAREGLEVTVAGGFTGAISDIREDGALLTLESGTELFVRFGDRVTAGKVSAPLGPPRPDGEGGIAAALRAWRKERARADDIPAYIVLHDRTLDRIAELRPAAVEELITVPGMGPVKCERYGDEILAICRAGR
jgi:DNA helicase-2/ATP-dependent DNA helicase PcrA